MISEFSVDFIVSYRIGTQGFHHSPVSICLTDRAPESVFSHQASDLFTVHADIHTHQTHIDSAIAFVIPPKLIRLLDLGEIRQILLFAFTALRSCTEPSVITGTGNTGKLAQFFDITIRT